MKKMGKLAAFVLAAVLLLTNCGQQNQGNSDNSDITDPYVINWFIYGSGQTDITTVEAEINKYLKDKINATVKMNILDYSTYEPKINMMLAGDEPLDLMFSTNWVANYKSNAAKGALLPLNDLIDKYAPEAKKMLKDKLLKGSEDRKSVV